jgi:hypothetical protein
MCTGDLNGRLVGLPDEVFGLELVGVRQVDTQRALAVP